MCSRYRRTNTCDVKLGSLVDCKTAALNFERMSTILLNPKNGPLLKSAGKFSMIACSIIASALSLQVSNPPPPEGSVREPTSRLNRVQLVDFTNRMRTQILTESFES